MRRKTSLFDHLVGGAEHRLRYGEVKRFRGFEVDGEFNFRGLLHRQVGWLLAVEDSTSIHADEAIGVGKVRSVAHQPTGRGKLTQGMDRRHIKAGRERSKLIQLTIEVWICTDNERASSQFNLIAGVHQHRDQSGTWCDRVYKLDLFSDETGGHADNARNIAAGLLQEIDKPYLDRVGP